MKDMKELLIIGGATYDITGKIKNDIVGCDSNPSRVYTSAGGVGRNIAENTAHLKVNTAFITAVGDDVFAKEIRLSCETADIDTTGFIVRPEASSSVYITILDKEGELVMASSDLTILEETPVDMIKAKSDYIRGFPLVLFDTNLTSEMLETIAAIVTEDDLSKASDGCMELSSDKKKSPSCEGCDGTVCKFAMELEVINKQDNKQAIYADTVSVKKSVRLLGILDKIHTLKANRTELEALTKVKVEDISDAITAMEILIKKGVKRVFATLGMQGSCVMEDGQFFSMLAIPCEVVDVNGAGDSFMSAVIYGSLRGYSNRDILCLGTAAAHLTLKAKGAVNHDLDEQKLLRTYQTIKCEMRL